MPECIRGKMLVGQSLHNLLKMEEVVAMLGLEGSSVKQGLKFTEVHHFFPPVSFGDLSGEYVLFYREEWTGDTRAYDVTEFVRRMDGWKR